jgi:hypothetical protein
MTTTLKSARIVENPSRIVDSHAVDDNRAPHLHRRQPAAACRRPICQPSRHRRQELVRFRVAGLTCPILRVYVESGEEMVEQMRIFDEDVPARVVS